MAFGNSVLSTFYSFYQCMSALSPPGPELSTLVSTPQNTYRHVSIEQPADMEGILKVTKFPRAQLFGLRRDGTGRRVAGATFEEASQGSLCESIRAGQMVEHALLLHVTEEVNIEEKIQLSISVWQDCVTLAMFGTVRCRRCCLFEVERVTAAHVSDERRPVCVKFVFFFAYATR